MFLPHDAFSRLRAANASATSTTATSAGIPVVLAAASSLLIYAFDANLTHLIQLYVIGVFTSFTLSQTGMVLRWRRLHRAGQAPRRGPRR